MIMKRFGYLFLTVFLLASLGQVSAAAGDDPPVDESRYVPKVKLSSSSTVEVSEGKTEEIEIEVRNVGTGRADNFFIQVLPGPEDPFTLSVVPVSGSDIIQAGVSKKLKLKIVVEKGAAGKVYPIELKYSYINTFRAAYTESDTLNIKVNNPLSAANIRLYNFELSPAVLKAGQTGVLSFNYMNMGSADEKNVRLSLDGLDTSKITVPNGLNALDLPIVRPFVEEKASFGVKAASGLKNGSYPINVITTIKNSAGEAATETLQYFISVGGSAETGEASFDVLNQSVPSKTHDVGESFTISFDLINTTNAEANNVLVKANAVEGDAIVPTSQSMFLTRSFKANETKRYSFTFAATSNAKTQNYPISFTIEYDAEDSSADSGVSKISFSQYFGVNIYNPEEEEDEESDKNKNIPKIIVSSYSCDPVIVPAGEEFDLSMTFMNSHTDKAVKNIKVSLTVTDKDENIGASIFSPVNASNTLYVDQILPGQTVSRSIRYYAVPDANPQNYSINVNFEYEDAEGSEIKTLEIIGVNVSQPPSIETSDITIPEFSDAGMPIFFNFEIYNTGRVAVNNLKVVLEGEMQSDSKTTWIGTFESGSNEWIDSSFYYSEPGPQEGRIIVSYDSTTGEHFEIPKEFSIVINEPMPMDLEGLPPDMMPEDGMNGGVSKTKIAIGAGIGVIVLAVAGFIAYKVIRKKKQAGDDFDE